ncbi:hypothetical protein D3OALGA1CA_1370 [Olavius algarvensis associated proteobacterium Delta 3]|nr:hypothetical protein D3OALGA1CA_1370 [Olavius algarvensis associated proteobacterium Delta 3]
MKLPIFGIFLPLQAISDATDNTLKIINYNKLNVDLPARQMLDRFLLG